MFELLLTRIFSVTLWYHFAFMAVSLAMFGLTAGAMAVYFLPAFFRQERKRDLCWLYSFLFSIAIVVTFWLNVGIPHAIEFSSGLTVVATFAILVIPFFFSGVVVCLVLSGAKEQIGKLYAWDLSGAAIGCLAIIAVLEAADAPSAVVWVSQLACLGALMFSLSSEIVSGSINVKAWFSKLSSKLLAVWFVAITTLALINPTAQIVKLGWSKGGRCVPIYEKWNSFSRVRVSGNPDIAERPFGWGLSTELPANIKVRQLNLDIDSAASTILTAFNGDIATLTGLKYDVTNAVHYIRPNANVLVIGAGGGRDILSALAFGQKSVIAAEMNPNIIKVVTKVFEDFTGHLDKNPKVTLLNEEGRSYLAHTSQQFDIIQLSLVDTWAASSAGAFSLSENSLYTRECWDLMLSKLSPDGVLSATRWYTARSPGEIYRLTSLASQALRDIGIGNIRKHMVLIRVKGGKPSEKQNNTGLGTLLVSKQPFSQEQLDTLESLCKNMKFEIVLSPRHVDDKLLDELTSNQYALAIESSALRLDAPTDDSPYFFQMIRLKDWLRLDLLEINPDNSAYATAMLSLGSLTILVSCLTVAILAAPFLISSYRKHALQGAPLCLFFSAIGLAFILIEISIIQRFQIFLGIPIYSLSVTLFTLLVTSAFGSYISKVVKQNWTGSAPFIITALVITAIAMGFGQVYVIKACAGLPILSKICITIALISPLGLLMGCPFPLGMQLADGWMEEIKPWLWACNGALSVFASVAAVNIGLASGISTSYWVGCGAYGVALGLYCLISAHKNRRDETHQNLS